MSAQTLRSLAALAIGLALVAVAALAYVALRDPQHRADSGRDDTARPAAVSTAPTPSTPWAPVRTRVSTFNVLGYGHTMPGGDNKLKVDGRTRQSQADQIIRASSLEIIGFQEMEQPQIDVFKAEMGASYALWPANEYSGQNAVNVRGNSIAWRTDLWTAISQTYYNAPYFEGAVVPRPIVLLQNNATGAQVYVTNTHNPANTKGNAKNYRDQSVDIQAATFNAMRAASPQTPIIFTGDMNDTTNFYCRITSKSSLRAANGGTRTASTCTLPKSPQIDWIMSTPDVQWNGYQAVRTAYVKQTTDHPVVWADATIKSPMARGIGRAVVLDIEGLPSSETRFMPRLTSILAAGSGTLDARTTTEAKPSLPNLVSILTGHPVAKASGGHGVIFGKDKPRKRKFTTLRSATGAYVNTIFDTVHNQGGSTSFMSTDPNAAIVIRSAKAGVADSQGVDYGKRKLTVASIRGSDAKAVKVLRTQLAKSPRTLSYLQLTGPRVAGERYGYGSRRYRKALTALDKRISAVLGSARARGNVALIITASSGGLGRRTTGTALTQNQVPLVVWGPGVPAHGDLYAMNPGWLRPGGTPRIGYAGPQPLHNANVANIVTSLLGYPSMPTPTPYGGPINVLRP